MRLHESAPARLWTRWLARECTERADRAGRAQLQRAEPYAHANEVPAVSEGKDAKEGMGGGMMLQLVTELGLETPAGTVRAALNSWPKRTRRVGLVQIKQVTHNGADPTMGEVNGAHCGGIRYQRHPLRPGKWEAWRPITFASVAEAQRCLESS